MRTLDAPVLVGALSATLTATILSGMLLAFVYDGFPDERVRSSMLAIESSPFWSATRAVHAAAASLTVVAASLASARFFMDGAKGRAVGYGALTVVLLLAAYQSGVILPMDQRAWEAWTHVRDAAAFVGVDLREPLPTVAALHGAVLGPVLAAPAAILAYRAFRPRAQFLAASSIALLAVGTLAWLAAPTLGPEPVEGLAVSRPHWPFLWLSPLQDRLGTAALLALPAIIAGLALLAWRAPRWTLRTRQVVLAGVLVALALLTLLAL